MQLRTKVGTLLDTYALVAPTLDKKGTSANLYLNMNDKSGFLYMYSTNLACETAAKLKPETEDVKAGEVLVNPSKLTDGLAGLPKDTPVTLVLTEKGNALNVKAGNVKFSLSANTNAKELGDRLRAIPSKSEPAAVVPTAELSEFIRRSIFCIPNDQTGQRANLAALKISDIENGGEEALATDGSIAVHVTSSKKQGKGSIGSNGILIPAQALQALSALVAKKSGEKVSIILTEKKNKIFFKFADGTHFGALTLASVFPNLKTIMDRKSSFVLDIPRELFKQSLNRATSFVSSVASKSILELEFGPENLSIKANGDDILSDSIPILYTGDKPLSTIRLGMNIAHLVNITSGSSSEHLTFGFTNPDTPLTVIDTKGEDEETIHTKYVVMGVKLSA